LIWINGPGTSALGIEPDDVVNYLFPKTWLAHR
jgi:hypothetical protein